MLIPVQVLTSRNYSFAGQDGHPVNIVEAYCMITLDGKTIVAKINTRGAAALKPGDYQARLFAAERNGKLVLSLGDLTPSGTAYKTASGAN